MRSTGGFPHLRPRVGAVAEPRTGAGTDAHARALRIGVLTAVLSLTISVLPGAAAGKRAAAPRTTVTPAVVNERLPPGGSLTVDKKVRTPVVPPRPDVVLLVDGTRSMQPTIDNVQTNLDQITSRVREEQPDSRFAVATFGDKIDGDRVFTVLQGLTDNLDAVRRGVNALKADRGLGSPGPAEDWINALWQIGNGAGGTTVFRQDASPVVVLVGDASSHDPSMGHSLADSVNALKNAGVRVIGVDVTTHLGDGLNGNGNNGNDDNDDPDDDGQNGEPTHEPHQATKVVQATGGKLFQNIDAEQVTDTIVEGLTNLPTTVSHQTVACDPALTVSLTPASREVTSGAVADFRETIKLAADAPQGATLDCTVQFLLDGKPPSGEMPADAPPAREFRDQRAGTADGNAEPTPEDYQQHITITVDDVTAPVVTVDDRVVGATGKNGTKVDFTATAEDTVDGELPVTCAPASGSLFPIGTTEVTCTATDSSGNTGSDTATFTVTPAPVPDQADIAVTATADPSPRYAGRRTGARFTLTNAGPRTARNIVLTTTWPRVADSGKRTLSAPSGCTRAAPCSLAPGERLTVTQSAVYRSSVRGDIRVSVTGSPRDPRRADNTDTARVRVLRPSLTVTPKVARPGDVAVARGKDFPPGATVALTWKPGITAARSTVRVAGDGTFEAQVLVLRKDRLGPRKLRATVRGMERLEKPVLIVRRSLQPPDFAGRG
ncbi:VWA domain-containing protein [Streptomyces sparsogenes]|uniref:VWA domain-containing protein n=1 Tax=Streptomyces sparsogenes TaxID=67365 RepID=UPI0033C9C3C5